MKYVLFFLFSVTAISSHAQSITDRVAVYREFGQYIQTPVRAYHNFNYKDELAGLKGDYTFHILFQIDTAGKVINLHSKHRPTIPQSVINYSYNLIKATSGMWKPEVKNCRLVVSDTITCQFQVVRTKTFDDFASMKLELDTDFIVSRADGQQNICWISITYQ